MTGGSTGGVIPPGGGVTGGVTGGVMGGVVVGGVVVGGVVVGGGELTGVQTSVGSSRHQSAGQ